VDCSDYPDRNCVFDDPKRDCHWITNVTSVPITGRFTKSMSNWPTQGSYLLEGRAYISNSFDIQIDANLILDSGEDVIWDRDYPYYVTSFNSLGVQVRQRIGNLTMSVYRNDCNEVYDDPAGLSTANTSNVNILNWGSLRVFEDIDVSVLEIP